MEFFYNLFIKLGLNSSFAEALSFFFYEMIFLSFILMVGLTFFTYIRLRFINENLEKSLEKKPKILVYGVMALLGIVSPFCSCSTIPAFISLSRLNIPTGALFVYLIVSPLVQETSMILLISEFGIITTILYISFGIITGTIIGLSFSKLQKNDLFLKTEEQKDSSCCNSSCCCEENKKEESVFTKARKEAFSIYKDVYKYIIIGVAFGSLIHGIIPQQWIEYILGKNNYIAPIYATLIGIPIYADDVALIPIAKSLLDSGAALGTSLSFVMGASVVSVPSFILLSSILKKKAVFRLALILTISLIIIGYVFNYLQKFLI